MSGNLSSGGHLGSRGDTRSVGLPELIGKLSLEADKRSLGPSVGLRRDQALALEDAPDGDSRRGLVEAAGEVMEDGLRTGVESGRRLVGAELEDGVDYGLVDLVATGGWAVGLRLKGSGSVPSIAASNS
jgi:hypothetical protein